MSAPTTIRFATPADGPGIARVHIAAWRMAYRGIMADQVLADLDPERVARRWTHDLEAGFADAVVLVAALPDGRIQGIGSCGDARDEAPLNTQELWMLNCHPEVWGLGVGRQLLLELERQLVDRGARRAYLWVAEKNPRARHFYAREGWWDTGITRRDDRFDPAISECRYAKHLDE